MAKILIVDDEKNILMMLGNRLRENGYEVIEACDGMEALNLVRKENPDLIILDLMLPKMDGYTVCGLVKNDKRFSHIPVIILSARNLDIDVIRGKEAGADEYIKKPFQSDKLLCAIERHLSKNI